MADSLVGKLGEQIRGQISGFTSGMKGAFVGANPALLGPALSGIEKAFKGQSAAMRKEQEQRRAERGFAEENANEQRKLFTDILGEQKETNDYLKKILEALLGKNQEEPWWKKILGPLIALAKMLKDGFGKLVRALEKLFDLFKAFKFDDLFRNFRFKIGDFLSEIGKFFKELPRKLLDFAGNLFKRLGGLLPETTKALKKLFSDLADILKLDNIKGFFNKALASIGNAFGDLVKLIKESNLFKAFASLIDDLKALPAEIGARIRGAVKAVKESNLTKYIDELFGAFNAKFVALTNTIDAKFASITDAIKTSSVGKAASKIGDDLASLGRAFVSDIRARIPAGAVGGIDPSLAARAKEALQKPGFARTADDLVAIKALDQAKAAGAAAGDVSALTRLKNLIPDEATKFIDDIGVALGKVFGFLKNVGSSIADSASGIGKFLASVTDLDVMMNVIGKFVKALPVIGWIFTTIDGLQAAFDTAGLAETLGKKAEDVTLADRLKGFVGGFFGSFFGIVDFFEKLVTGNEGTLQKDMTAAIIKLTDEVAGQFMDFFKFWGNILTSEPMMAIYKFVGQLAGVAFEFVGNSLKSVIELIVGVLTFNPEKIMGGIKNLYDSFLNAFADTFSVIGNFLKTPIAKLANVVTDMFESAINFFVDGMNWMMSKLQSIPGVGRLFAGVGFERVALGRMDETTGKAPTTGAPVTSISTPRPVPQAESQAVTISRPSAPPVVAPQPGAGGMPLSVRNNNPGNLRYAGQAGVIGVDSKGFAIFESPEAGMNAMMRQLNLDTQTREKTLSQFVNKYAPSSENDTQNYINFLSSRLGVGPNERIPPEKLPELRRAMIQMEGGQAASQYYYGGGGPGGQPPRLVGAPQGPSGKPTDPVSIETVLSDEERLRQADIDVREEENLRILQEGRAFAENQERAEQARHAAVLDQMKRQEDIVNRQIQNENLRYQQERDNLYRQFNQTAKNIYATGLRSAIGNLGVTGQQAFMMGGSSVVDKYLGDSFKKIGEKLFGKEQGGGMGFIFQKLVGSYANQAVNQILAPALGISAPLMNRALSNFAAGNKREAYADIVFGMTGVPIDTRTFLEFTTGRVGVENAIEAFSQGLADITTGPMSGLFQLAPNGMGMYKVDLENPNQDPTVLASQIAANNIHASSQLFGQNVLLAGKTMAEIGVLGAQTEAQIAETGARNAAMNLQGTQGGSIFSAIGDFFSETFGFKKPSGTMPGAAPGAGRGDWYQTPSGMMVYRTDLSLPTAGGTAPSAATNLMGTLGNFLGFAGGQAIGKGLGINTNTLGGSFAQAGVNSLTSSFMNALFTVGPAAAFAGLKNTFTTLMAIPSTIGNAVASGASWLGTASGATYGTAAGSQQTMMLAAQEAGMGASAGSTAATMGSMAEAATGIVAGHYLGRAIAGGYRVGGMGNSTTNIGTAIGFAIGGPIGAVIGGAIGGSVNRLFGRKAPQVTASGIQGTLGADTNLQTYNDILEKGGRYRSDKRYTTYSAADEEFVKGVEKAVVETTTIVEGAAKALSLEASSFKTFTKDVTLQLSGLTPEQQKEAITKMITDYTEDMLTSVYPEISQYRREIEGKLETNVEAFQRLANSTIAAENAFRTLGYTAEEITDVLGIAISDTATKLAAANVKQQMIDAFGGDQRMAATLQNYLGKVYSPEKLEAIKLSMAKATMADIVKENAPLQTVLDITKYNSIEEARAAHLAAFDAAMKASDFATANTLASSYDAFIEGVRLNLREKARTAQPDTQADVVSTYIDPALATVYSGLAEDQAIAMTPVAATSIVSAVGGTVDNLAMNAEVSTAASGTTGAYLSEQYSADQGGGAGVTNNTTAIDNSTVIATRPTSITVMRDDSVRDYHPILGASNRGLSGGYGWGNDYQGSFGAG